jgi:hypothetical protein
MPIIMADIVIPSVNFLMNSDRFNLKVHRSRKIFFIKFLRKAPTNTKIKTNKTNHVRLEAEKTEAKKIVNAIRLTAT